MSHISLYMTHIIIRLNEGVFIMTKVVYSFEEGKKEMKSLLGDKGANLAEMTKLGLPVPYGFTITTEACIDYLRHKTLTSTLKKEILCSLHVLEKQTGKK